MSPTVPQGEIMYYYLKHPVHGTKTASLVSEVEQDIEVGWEEYDPTEVVVPDEPVVEETPAKTKKEKPSFME